ncbi:MAG: serine hydrolase [Burkholderiales bacterium]
MPRAAPSSSLRRRLAAGGAGAGALLALAGCAPATPQPAPITTRSAPPARPGPAKAPAGPELNRYADAQGRYPRATRASWSSPAASVDGFSRLDEIFPANTSARAAAARPWRRPLAGTPVGAPIDDYLARNPVTGLLIAREDVILAERYQYGRGEAHRFTAFSMAGGLLALMAGIALQERRLRLDDPAQLYVPALAGSAYGATPVRHLLTMSSGMRPRDELSADDAEGMGLPGGWEPGGARAARLFEERLAPPGERWHPSVGDTFVLALVLRAVAGQPLCDYFSDRIWKPIGAEADASWIIDRSGQELGFTGFNAVLRDYARLGAMLARQGRADYRQVVSAAWLRELARAQVSARQTGRGWGYGYQSWVFTENDGSFAWLGERGQALMVDPARRLVLVQTAVRPQSRDGGLAETVALWQSLRRAHQPLRLPAG